MANQPKVMCHRAGSEVPPLLRLTFDLEESQPGKYKACDEGLDGSRGQAKNVNGGSAPRTQDAMMGKAQPDMQPQALFLTGHSS